MPTCQNCGARVSEVETNCRNCGAFIYPKASGITAAPYEKSRRRGAQIFIAAIIIVCVVAVALIMLAAQSRTNSIVLPLPDPAAFTPDNGAETVPAPTDVSAPLRLGTWWHGMLEISNYSGDGESRNGTTEIWGYLGAASGRRPYFELYDSDTLEEDTAVLLSMYVELYPNHFVPVIGDEDAWLLDIYLDERDVDPLTVYYQDGALDFSYFYETNEESFDVHVAVHEQ